MVVHTMTGDIARVGEREMSCLSIEDADDLAELLNHLAHVRPLQLN